MLNKFEIIHLDCCCSDVEHSLRFMYDPEDPDCPIYTEIVLSKYHGFWMRVKLAIKYIFGKQSDCGHFDCFLMEKGPALELQEFIENAYSHNKAPE